MMDDNSGGSDIGDFIGGIIINILWQIAFAIIWDYMARSYFGRTRWFGILYLPATILVAIAVNKTLSPQFGDALSVGASIALFVIVVLITPRLHAGLWGIIRPEVVDGPLSDDEAA